MSTGYELKYKPIRCQSPLPLNAYFTPKFKLFKGAFDQYEQSVNKIRLNAEEYWLRELTGKDEATIRNYQRYLRDFLAYLNTTADKLLQQRMEHLKHDDIKVQRTVESYFLQFLKDLKKKREYENGTLQVVFASIRSFFEMNYVPLRTRRKDYPKNTPNGVRRATNKAIMKVLTENKPRNKETFKALLMAFKDTGLRVIDLLGLNCDVILENLDKEIIQITIKTEKTGYIAKTFLGKDAIDAFKEYFEARSKGSRKIEPEKLTGNSPLIRTWEKGRVKRMSRMGASTIIRNAFLAVGEKKMSAHSLRKQLQTDLERAGVNSNWIDQILGHELINSRDAYSLPTDEELKEAYQNAYHAIQINPENKQTTKEENKDLEVAEARTMEEVKQLLAKGYKYEMDYEGVKLFTKG
jgi:site-specific recombinase XerD